jgi:hypothetical protein
VAEHGAGELEEEPFDEVELGTVLWGEDELETMRRLVDKPSAGFSGDGVEAPI